MVNEERFKCQGVNLFFSCSRYGNADRVVSQSRDTTRFMGFIFFAQYGTRSLCGCMARCMAGGCNDC